MTENNRQNRIALSLSYSVCDYPLHVPQKKKLKEQNEISKKHNTSYFLNDIKKKLRKMRRTFKKTPIQSILNNFDNVEIFFQNKAYLKPDKFWGYGIGRVDNGSKNLPENTLSEEGVYLTIFRFDNKKLLFEYYQIRENGQIEEKVLPNFSLDLSTITEIKISNHSFRRRDALFIYSKLFTNYIAIPTSDKETAEYYKKQIQLLSQSENSSAEELKIKIDSDYIHQKIKAINSTQNSDTSIGLSTDLIETVCKTILYSKSVAYDEDWKTVKYIRACNKLLKLELEETENSEQAERTLRQLLSGIGTTIQGIAEIRNEIGTGHERDSSFAQIKQQYSNLISSSVFQLSIFYLSHFKKELNN